MIELDELTDEENVLLKMAFGLLTEALKYDEYNEHGDDLFNLKMKLGIWRLGD